LKQQLEKLIETTRAMISKLGKEMRAFESNLSALEDARPNSTFVQSLRNQFEMHTREFDVTIEFHFFCHKIVTEKRMKEFHATCEKVKKTKDAEIERKLRLCDFQFFMINNQSKVE